MPGLALDVAVLVLGILVLYFGAEWLVLGAARLAGSLGVSPMAVSYTHLTLPTKRIV